MIDQRAARGKYRVWLAPVLVLAIALVLFSLNLGRPPNPDELHHALAAQRLLETGLPWIGEGQYWRGILHTWMVAVSYEIFGDSLASARLPAVLFAALATAVLFSWVRREAGALAAWIATVLFISSPFTIEIAQFSRFYALQLFCFVLGALCAFYAMATAAPPSRRVLLSLLTISFLSLATWLQETSALGLAGIAVWVGGLLALRTVFGTEAGPGLKRGMATALVAAGACVVAAGMLTGVLEGAWERYRTPMLFNADLQDEFWFYHVRFLILYPTLWPLVGLLAVFAAVRTPRLAWLSISVFGISFLLASFAGPKATRYFSFATPFLAILWGVGLAHVLPLLWRYTSTTRLQLSATLALPGRFKSTTATTLLGLAIAILVLTNPFWLRSALLIGSVDLPFETPTTDWRAAEDTLAPWTTEADIMITTEELGAMYFLGRSDVRYSPSKLRELDDEQRREFGIDFRTGRPVIATPESLERLIECFDRGIVVGPIEHWGSPILISESVQAVLKRHARPIDVPKESHLYAWGWERKGSLPKPDNCAELRRFSGRKAR